MALTRLPVDPDPSHERLDELHPEFVARLLRFFDDPEVRGRFSIDSAVRTVSQQRWLFDGYRAGKAGFNLAANPDRVFGTTDEGWQARGSWHMVQADGHAYAVDLSKPATMSVAEAKRFMDRVAPQYGLRRTVPSEWWHLQPRNVRGWFPDPSAPVYDGRRRKDPPMGYFMDATTKDVWLIGRDWLRDVSEQGVPDGAHVEPIGGLVDWIIPDLKAHGYVDITGLGR